MITILKLLTFITPFSKKKKKNSEATSNDSYLSGILIFIRATRFWKSKQAESAKVCSHFKYFQVTIISES